MRNVSQTMKKTENTDVMAASQLAAMGEEKMILVIRDKQVLLDRDLATLYGVEARRINEQVMRNKERIPEDFCFQLNRDEIEFVKSQIATSRGDGFFSGRVCALVNEAIPAEYQEVLARPKFELQEETIETLISELQKHSMNVRTAFGIYARVE